MVEHIVEDSVEIARRSRGEPPREASAKAVRRRKNLDAVYGWQELILNRGADCTRCDADLSVGEAAYRGLTDEPGPPAFLCRTCIRRLREPANGKEQRS